MWSHVNLNKVGTRGQVGSHAQKCHRCNDNFINGYITTYISSCLNIYPVIDKARSRVSKTRRFYFTRKFGFLYFRINISQISTISTIWTKIWAYHIEWYVTTCFQIQSWIIFFVFFVTYLAYILFLLVCENFTLTLKTGRCRNPL